jgi:hypothetical protein
MLYGRKTTEVDTRDENGNKWRDQEKIQNSSGTLYQMFSMN